MTEEEILDLAGVDFFNYAIRVEQERDVKPQRTQFQSHGHIRRFSEEELREIDGEVRLTGWVVIATIVLVGAGLAYIIRHLFF